MKRLSTGTLQEAHASASWGSQGCGRFVRGEVLDWTYSGHRREALDSERDTPVQGCLSHTKTTSPRTLLNFMDQTYPRP